MVIFAHTMVDNLRKGVEILENSHVQLLYKQFLKWLTYKPSEHKDKFVLDQISEAERADYITKKSLGCIVDRVEDLVYGAKSVAEVMADAEQKLRDGIMDEAEFAKLKSRVAILEARSEEMDPLRLSYEHGNIDIGRQTISNCLNENKNVLSKIYHLPKNLDLQIREFELKGTLSLNLMMGYIDGMVDKAILSAAIMKPLMLMDAEDEGLVGTALVDKLVKNLVPHVVVQRITTFKEATVGINSGDCVLFIEGAGEALQIDAKGYKSRGIGKAEIEKTVRGSQAAFGESLRENTALVHAMLQSTDLVTEMYPLGKINAKNCGIMYVEGIVNEIARNELVRRIKGTKCDDVFDAGSYTQALSDNQWQFPEYLSTERPDRVVAALMQGRIALMVQGDPFAYIAPVNLWDFFHNPEDYAMRVPAAMFMRILRYVGTFLTFVMPSLYISLITFHYEAIPTELLLAVAGYRQFVPFPSLVEVLMMIFAFELIREATLRVPGQLGGSIGIVGAIILGQAAVTAKLVSPLLVVVIAITGLSSYVIPEYRMGFAFRLSQYFLLFAAAVFGLFGVSLSIVLLMCQMLAMKSLGVPMLAPIIPRTSTVADIIRLPAAQGEIFRPDELNVKRKQKAPSKEELWRKQKPKKGGE